MSDSMYAIGWLELKEYDRAYANFRKMFEHVAGDFQVNSQVTLWLFSLFQFFSSFQLSFSLLL